MQKSKIRIYLGFVIILFVVILFFTVKDNCVDILYSLSEVNLWWLILGILLVFLSKYFIGITTYELGIRENKNISLSKMIQIAFIYPFYAGITPSSIGGEGFEIFYLKQCDISYGGATNIQMQKFILYVISLISMNALAVIFNLFTGVVVDSSLVGSAVTINFIVNLALLGGCYLITYNKWVKNFILNSGVKLLTKIRVIKNAEESRDKIDSFLVNFDEGAKALNSNKKLFWKLIIYNFLSIVLLMIASWPIARAMHITNISIINLFILSTYIRMMCLLVVTPGTSGAAEYCFIYLFSSLASSNDIIAYMLIWRLVTYYIPLIAGGMLALLWERRKRNEKITCTES